MSRDLLNSSFLDTVVQDGKLVYKFDKKQHVLILLHNLIAMQENNDGSMTDVIIISKDDEQFQFHAPILAALSKHLEEILVQKCAAHATSMNPNIIIKEEFSSEAVQCLWDYAYKSSVVLTPSNITEMKEMAEHYGLENLEDECELLEEEGFEGDHDGVKLEFKNLPEFISERLYTFLRASKFCSAVITGSEPLAKIPCHKAVIAATCSELLTAELTHGDSDEDTSESIQVNDTTFQVMAPFLRYLYTASLMVEPANVQQLLEMAVTFNLPGMEHACCCWLEDSLTANNVLGIMEIAQDWQASNSQDSVNQYNALQDLYQAARRFAVNNFLSVQENDEFLEMSLEELSSLIDDDNLVVNSEEDVFHAVMKWVEFDPETRAVEFPHLLQSVRLEHLSIGFLDTILEHDLVKKNSLCVELIQKALQDSLQQSYLPPKHDTEDRDVYDSLLSSSTDQNELSELISTQPSDFNTFVKSSLPESFNQPFDCVELIQKALQDSLQQSYPPSKHDTEDRDVYDSLLSSSTDQNDLSELISTQPSDLNTFVKSSLPESCNQPFDNLPLQESFFPKKRDMRLRRNREALLERGKNIDGTPDKRLRENKAKSSVAKKLTYSDEELPKRKDGQLDRRFKVVKELNRSKIESGCFVSGDDMPRQKIGKPDIKCKINKMKTSEAILRPLPEGPKRKDGQPDMRFKANRYPTKEIQSTGPKRKDGQPDMRYSANKQKVDLDYQTPRREASTAGPKKNGTSDMRFAEKKKAEILVSSSVPLKKDGTPDMRFAVNKRLGEKQPNVFQGPRKAKANQTPDMWFAANNAGTPSSGPLKKDGTPDMRYRSNQRNSSTGSASSNFIKPVGASSMSRGDSGNYQSSAASGPLKLNGTPDMRYASNRISRSGGYPLSVSGSSSGSHVSSDASSSGPRLKKDGTPDMRYKCNKSLSSSSSSSFGSRSSTSSGWTTSSFSSGYSGSSHVSSSRGPLKKDGTPDMRYKANRR